MSVVFPVGYFQGPQPESAVPLALVALAPGPSLRPTRDVKSATAHEQINMLLLLLLLLLILFMVKKIKKIKDSRRARVDLPVDRNEFIRLQQAVNEDLMYNHKLEVSLFTL